jgi:hypothetical protein
VDYALLRSSDELSRAEDGAAILAQKKEAPHDPPGRHKKRRPRLAPLQDACGLKSWLEIPQRNSKVVFNVTIPRSIFRT